MKRPALLLAPLLVGAALAAGAGPLPALAASTGAATTCPTGWGSLPETADPVSQASLSGVRTGRHECYDRLVLDVTSGSVAGWDVRYVPTITEDGSGRSIPTRGGAALQVVARVPAYDASGSATYAPADPRELTAVGGYRTFRQVVWAGTFEGQSTVGLGVRARLPFRVLALAGPGGGSRLVVDVAHSW